MTVKRCPEHNCPLIDIDGNQVCLIEYTEALTGLRIEDLLITDKMVSLVMSNGNLLPLVGFDPNGYVRHNQRIADGIFDIVVGRYLLETEWIEENDQFILHLGTTWEHADMNLKCYLGLGEYEWDEDEG